MRRRLALATLAFAAAACLPRPRPTPPVLVYDLGPPAADEPAAPAVIPIRVVVRPPEAPLWVDSPAISYRLAYEDPALIRSYAYSSWVSSPVRLIGDLLQRRIALASALPTAAEGGVDRAAELVLQSTVEELSQVFDTPAKSRAVLRARLALIRQSDRQAVARRTFTIERPAPTPDAPGAVRGLGEASRELADRVVAWVAETAVGLTQPGPRGASDP